MKLRKRVPDDNDILLLLEIRKAELQNKISPTLTDLTKTIRKSIGTVSTRITWLKEEGYLENTIKNQPRSLKLTEEGKQLLIKVRGG